MAYDTEMISFPFQCLDSKMCQHNFSLFDFRSHSVIIYGGWAVSNLDPSEGSFIPFRGFSVAWQIQKDP